MGDLTPERGHASGKTRVGTLSTVQPTGPPSNGFDATAKLPQVDRSNGNRSLVSTGIDGSTPFGSLTFGIAVYPTVATAVPEPSSAVLTALGAVGLAVYAG